MDNLGIWIVVLILAYAVLRLWQWTEKRLKQHVVHIDKLLYQVEHLEERVFEEDIKEAKIFKEFEDGVLEKFGVKSSRELKGDKLKEYYDYFDKAFTEFNLKRSENERTSE